MEECRRILLEEEEEEEEEEAKWRFILSLLINLISHSGHVVDIS